MRLLLVIVFTLMLIKCMGLEEPSKLDPTPEVWIFTYFEESGKIDGREYKEGQICDSTYRVIRPATVIVEFEGDSYSPFVQIGKSKSNLPKQMSGKFTYIVHVLQD